jgi:hypothetical protein
LKNHFVGVNPGVGVARCPCFSRNDAIRQGNFKAKSQRGGAATETKARKIQISHEEAQKGTKRNECFDREMNGDMKLNRR